MTKNILALIGLYTVVRLGVKFYDKHVRTPVERKIADIMTSEVQGK